MYCISVLFYLAFLAKSSFSYLIKSIANIYANLNNSYGKISDLLDYSLHEPLAYGQKSGYFSGGETLMWTTILRKISLTLEMVSYCKG